jgi:hypothetical protein
MPCIKLSKSLTQDTRCCIIKPIKYNANFHWLATVESEYIVFRKLSKQQMPYVIDEIIIDYFHQLCKRQDEKFISAFIGNYGCFLVYLKGLHMEVTGIIP